MSKLLLLILPVLLAACSSTPPSTTEVDPAGETQLEGQVITEDPADAIEMSVPDQVVDISMDDFSFSEPEIRVQAGQLVRVNITNTSGTHDFVIDELQVNSGIVPAGETGSVEFYAETPGEYEYYCSVGSHREMGMVGKLIVE